MSTRDFDPRRSGYAGLYAVWLLASACGVVNPQPPLEADAIVPQPAGAAPEADADEEIVATKVSVQVEYGRAGLEFRVSGGA